MKKAFTLSFFAVLSILMIAPASADTHTCYAREGLQPICSDNAYRVPDGYIPQVGDRRIRQNINFDGSVRTDVAVYDCDQQLYSSGYCHWVTNSPVQCLSGGVTGNIIIDSLNGVTRRICGSLRNSFRFDSFSGGNGLSRRSRVPPGDLHGHTFN